MIATRQPVGSPATRPGTRPNGHQPWSFCGDSAGGNLAIVTAMALRDAPAAVPVIAQLPIYPATDASREYPSYTTFAEGFLLTRDSMEWFEGGL